MSAVRRGLQIVAGLAVGVAIIEGGAWLRDGGAFPHLNVYRADPALGVRLRAGATERISFSGNPVSKVRINESGYRGDSWPEHADNEIFIVGDSQAFGLGVDEEQSFAQRLGQLTKQPVANGAVPTYGPAEYDAVLAEVLPKRKPKTVVYTINLANDLFESAHDNRDRHTVWDGWAVRRETAPASVTQFPGRELLFRDSHAVFSLRGLLFRLQGDTDGAVPSEGTWRDVVNAAKTREEAAREAAAEAERARAAAATKLVEVRNEMRRIDGELDKTISGLNEGESEYGAGTLRAARANPGDIVRVYYGEGSQPIPLLAEQIKQAGDFRKGLEKQLREKHDEQALAMLAKREALGDDQQKILAAQFPAPRSRSPLRSHLERAKKLCDANGAELVLLVLPLDVQVSAKEWDKYPGAAKIDMASSRILVDDLVLLADELGVRTVDAWPVLEKAEPGAFLKGDLHMSEKGHEAVAHAIMDRLRRPAGAPSLAALPLGRTSVPAPQAFARAVAPNYVDGSDFRRLGCTGRQVAEWLWIFCKGSLGRARDVGHGDRMLINTPDGTSFVTQMRDGDEFHLALDRGVKTMSIHSWWGLDESAPYMLASDGGGAKKSAPVIVSDAEKALCACHKQSTATADCSKLYGRADEACSSTYATDCSALLRCSRGDRATPPRCASGQAPTGVIPRCSAAPTGP